MSLRVITPSAMFGCMEQELNMADNSKAIKDLEALKEALVNERRRVAAHERSDIHTAAKKLLDIQAQLDAVDAAIADENDRAPSVYETRGLAGF